MLFNCHVDRRHRGHRQLCPRINRSSGSVNILRKNQRSFLLCLYRFHAPFRALGYFAFAYFLLFRIVPSDARMTDTLGFDVFFFVDAFYLQLCEKPIPTPGGNPYSSFSGGFLILCFGMGFIEPAYQTAFDSLLDGRGGSIYLLSILPYWIFHLAGPLPIKAGKYPAGN